MHLDVNSTNVHLRLEKTSVGPIQTQMSKYYSCLLSATFLRCSSGRNQFLMKHILTRRRVRAIRVTLLSSCDLWDFPWCIGKCSTTRALREALQNPRVFHQPLGIFAAAWEIITERQRRCNIFSCLCTSSTLPSLPNPSLFIPGAWLQNYLKYDMNVAKGVAAYAWIANRANMFCASSICKNPLMGHICVCCDFLHL